MKILTHRPTDRRPVPANPKRRARATGKSFYRLLMAELDHIVDVNNKV